MIILFIFYYSVYFYSKYKVKSVEYIGFFYSQYNFLSQDVTFIQLKKKYKFSKKTYRIALNIVLQNVLHFFYIIHFLLHKNCIAIHMNG